MLHLWCSLHYCLQVGKSSFSYLCLFLKMKRLRRIFQGKPQLEGEALQLLSFSVPPEGWEVLYDERNKLYLDRQRGWVVKLFAQPHWSRAFYYGYLGKSKARRSYLYSAELERRSIGVAMPLCSLEEHSLGGLGRSLYISSFLEGYETIRREMLGRKVSQAWYQALARFIAELHQKGVLHEDLSPGNILYKEEGGEYHFALVDVNRMSFSSQSIGRKLAVANFKRLTNRLEVSTLLASYYAEQRGWPVAEVVEEVNREIDRFFLSRLVKLSRRYARRHYHIGRWQFFLLLLRYRLLCIGRKWASILGLKGSEKRLWQQEEVYYRYLLSPEDLRTALARREGYQPNPKWK